METAESLAIALSGKRVAIVHEWVAAYAGSEQVFEALAQMMPEADLFALSVDPAVEINVGPRAIRTTFLNNRFLRNRRGLTLPLMPLAWRLLGKGDYDVVITSHHAFAHCNRLARRGGVHFVYVHSPARYVWSTDIDSRGSARWLAPIRAALKNIDVRASARVGLYAANSSTVAKRIERYWRRESNVIFPPVRVEYFADQQESVSDSEPYVLGLGRWIPYKNLDLVIQAANCVGLPVKIAGRGPDRLRIDAASRAATVNVQVVENPTDSQLRQLVQNSACLCFPTVEDFGIVPVEAQAAGVPVAGLRAGGSLDTVLDGVSGVLVDKAEPELLGAAIVQAMRLDRSAIRQWASNFTRAKFEDRVSRWIIDGLAEEIG